MGYYKFNDDVYLVKGAVNHCIYDLRKEELYHIGDKVLLLINELFEVSNFYLNLKIIEREFIDFLITAEIIIASTEKQPVISILSLQKQFSPTFAWIEVTRKCNLSCTFCYEESNPYCSERMSIENFYHVINELKLVGIKNIQFIGGEPLVIKNDLKLMIKHCYNHFDFVEVYTNGTLIDEDWANFFKQHNVAVAISIHSYIPEEHDHLTKVKGSHKKALRGLEFIKKYQIPYRLGTVKNNSCNIGEKSINCNYTLQPKEPKLSGRADLSVYDLDMFKRKAITKKSKSYRINKQAVIVALSGHQCFIKDLYISSNLNIYPCVMERRISYGNLKHKNLLDVIKHQIRLLSKDNIETCRDCEFRYACFDCRPDANGHGLYDKPWYCTYSPQEGKWHDVIDKFEELSVEAIVGAPINFS